jgi:probable rRNA maturation factor
MTVVLTRDQTLRRLNRTYRGKDKPTDVLSFALGNGKDAHEPFGDVVISVDAAARQATARAADLEDELVRLLVHGTLHLCGHTHDEAGASKRMHALARRIVDEFCA